MTCRKLPALIAAVAFVACSVARQPGHLAATVELGLREVAVKVDATQPGWVLLLDVTDVSDPAALRRATIGDSVPKGRQVVRLRREESGSWQAVEVPSMPDPDCRDPSGSAACNFSRIYDSHRHTQERARPAFAAQVRGSRHVVLVLVSRPLTPDEVALALDASSEGRSTLTRARSAVGALRTRGVTTFWTQAELPSR